jgi:methylmalonyl-CoA epimerase
MNSDAAITRISEIRMGGLAPQEERDLFEALGALSVSQGDSTAYAFSPGVLVTASETGHGLEELVVLSTHGHDERVSGALIRHRHSVVPVETPPPTGPFRVDHVCVAVWDMPAAVAEFRHRGGRVTRGGDNPEHGVRGIALAFASGIDLELLAPLEGRGRLADHLTRHGEGLHHVTFKVQDIEAAIERLTVCGIPLTGTDLATPDWRETYIHPRAAGGALLQLAETPHGHFDPLPDRTLASVLHGGYSIVGNRMRPKAPSI